MQVVTRLLPLGLATIVAWLVFGAQGQRAHESGDRVLRTSTGSHLRVRADGTPFPVGRTCRSSSAIPRRRHFRSGISPAAEP